MLKSLNIRLIILMSVLCVMCFFTIAFAEEAIPQPPQPVSKWTDIHSVLENLYFLSGICIAIFAGMALKQIKIGVNQVEVGLKQLEVGLKQLELAKNDLQIRVERESVTMTAIQCEKYASEVIPMSNALSKLIEAEENNLIYKGIVTDFKMSDEVNKWLKQNHDKLYKPISEGYNNYWKITEFLNKLEGISIYFTRGICAEDIAFDCLAETFCREVQKYYPILCLSNYKNRSYQNVIKLYQLWANKILKLRLKEEADKLHSAFVQTETAAAAANTRCQGITPIGVAAATKK